jgi:D-mannonate dehydratase
VKNTFNLSGGDLGLDDDNRLKTIINKLKKTADEAHIKEVSESFKR